ncbi:GAF domain-containing protein [Rufibacter sediminis]|uniref:GAF domain-containing protein n=1 Tax=Rufibacter sediminis TaxID=2762756 RepID=A0ABR6VQ70_9BACT|nr:GAF domain-containing protein [Rufibacter sediminis]MBC3539342.1 GAF domain-containing protein [Rufibacter sediminis]
MKNTFGVEIIPENDAERIQKLHNYHILDTETEGPFKHIAELAAHVFKVPIALVSFVDAERVWFKGNVGMEGVSEVDRGVSLCSLAILRPEATVFEDTLLEPCLLTNPLVAGEFGLRFYAAVPITTYDGFHLGSVCIVDKAPRTFSADDQLTLEYMAKLVMDELDLWKCRLYVQALN